MSAAVAWTEQERADFIAAAQAAIRCRRPTGDRASAEGARHPQCRDELHVDSRGALSDRLGTA